jgi:oxazoline/thiazoline dehydrogenase
LSDALVLSWGEGVTAASCGTGALAVQGAGRRVTLRSLASVHLDAMRRFDPPGAQENRLVELFRGGNSNELAQWYYYVDVLTRRGFLCQSVFANGARLATLTALSSSFATSSARIVVGRRHVLSRFAYLRREGNQAALESPLSHVRIMLHDCQAMALVGAMTTPATIDELTERVGGLPAEAVVGIITLLLRGGMLAEIGIGGICTEDDEPALQSWAFHDLLFHARSRRGRYDAPYGGTYRLAERRHPSPALKPVTAGKWHDLTRPDLARLDREDPPLAWVQERRRSVRDFDAERPITEQQLGEFLFRVARVRSYSEGDVETPGGTVHMDFASRPYPAGGGLYELEFYAVVNQCPALEAGLYYYDPSGHRLSCLSGRTAEVNSLLRDAAESASIHTDNVQVLVILAARYRRLAWKYESIAYALTLKHVGVVFQTMYLAATAMGLGPCALGGGDSDLFARATGADYCSETSVGEFLLGSQRPGAIWPGALDR